MDVEDIKTALGIGDNTQDAVLAAGAAYATSLLEDYLNRRLPNEERTEEFRDVCARKLWLSAYPVDSITSILVNGTEIGVDSLKLSALMGFLYGGSGFYWDAESIEITYTGGYDPEAIPPALADVFLSLVKSYTNRGAGSGGGTVGMIKSVSIPEAVSVTFETSTASSSTSVSGDSSVPADISPYSGILLPFMRFVV